MSKKDFQAFAKIIRDRKNHIEGLTTQYNETRKNDVNSPKIQDDTYLAVLDGQYSECEYYAKELSNLFAMDNPRFDKTRFYTECGYSDGL